MPPNNMFLVSSTLVMKLLLLSVYLMNHTLQHRQFPLRYIDVFLLKVNKKTLNADNALFVLAEPCYNRPIKPLPHPHKYSIFEIPGKSFIAIHTLTCY